MLQLASAARPEDRTERLCALRRREDDLDAIGDGIARFDLDDAYAGALSGERTEAEDDDAAGAADALAVSEEIGERKLEFGALAGRLVVVTRCYAARRVP